MERDYRRHSRVYAFVRAVLLRIAIPMFRFEYDDLSGVEGPYIILSNHNTDYDPIFIAGAFKRHTYFVATENLTRMGFIGRFFIYFFNPIIHCKGKSGINTVKEILRAVKDGHNVCMFPEGNRSFNGLTNPIPDSTGKLIKKAGVTLVTFRIDGGYFTSPRWGVSRRRGRITGRKVAVYTPEMIGAMTADEINRAVRRDLYVDAYAVQKEQPIEFSGNRLAEKLESAVFMCPYCRNIGTLNSRGDFFGCTCGFSAVFDRFGYLNEASGKKFTVTELDSLQRGRLLQMAEASPGTLFSDEITIEEIDDVTHSVVSSSPAKLQGGREGLSLAGRMFPFKDISGLSIHRRNTIILRAYGRHLDLKGSESFNALKYLYLYKAFGAAEI